MFTKRHEEELAEIKALTVELGQRFEEILDELALIRQTQARLDSADPATKPGKRKAARAGKARAAKAAGPKKAAGAKKAGRPKKAGGLLAGQATAAPTKAAKRARAASAAAAGDGGRPRKQRPPGARKRRQPAEPAPRPDSVQE